MYVFHIETGQEERIRHLAVAVDAFFADDGSTHARAFFSAKGKSHRFERALERSGNGIAQGLMLIVGEALGGTFRTALDGIEFVGGTVPHVAHGVDVDKVFLFAMGEHHDALGSRTADWEIFHSGFIKNLFNRFLGRIGNLNENCGILGKENLHEVGFAICAEAVGVDFKTALGVGKDHFKESCGQTAGADVMEGKQLAAFHELLHGVKSGGKFGRVLNGGHCRADLVKGLRQSRAAEFELIGREVYVVEGGVCSVDKDRRHRAADIGYLAGSRDDDGAGSEHLLITVFLSHREGVLAGGNVDTERAGEIRTSLHGAVKGGILAFVAAGPHPVGAERHALQTLGQLGTNDIGERFGNGKHRTGGAVGQRGLRRMAD